MEKYTRAKNTHHDVALQPSRQELELHRLHRGRSDDVTVDEVDLDGASEKVLETVELGNVQLDLDGTAGEDVLLQRRYRHDAALDRVDDVPAKQSIIQQEKSPTLQIT